MLLSLSAEPFMKTCLLRLSPLLSECHPEEILGQRFQLGVWSTFINTSKVLLIYIILHTFSLLFLDI